MIHIQIYEYLVMPAHGTLIESPQRYKRTIKHENNEQSVNKSEKKMLPLDDKKGNHCYTNHTNHVQPS